VVSSAFFYPFFYTMGAAQSMCYNEMPDPLPPLPPVKVPEISEIRYYKPWRKDMAVGLVFFNPAKSKRMLMNYLYTIEKLKLANIPYYTRRAPFPSSTKKNMCFPVFLVNLHYLI
jgi:hypothetical protein